MVIPPRRCTKGFSKRNVGFIRERLRRWPEAKSKSRAGKRFGGEARMRCEEESEKEETIAAKDMDDQPGHTREGIGEEIFARQRQKEFQERVG
jgi:hypothetical protein